ncbi:MAG TPA: hypothetical protein VGK67_40400 [Myxococcales bacterium]
MTCSTDLAQTARRGTEHVDVVDLAHQVCPKHLALLRLVGGGVDERWDVSWHDGEQRQWLQFQADLVIAKRSLEPEQHLAVRQLAQASEMGGRRLYRIKKARPSRSFSWRCLAAWSEKPPEWARPSEVQRLVISRNRLRE